MFLLTDFTLGYQYADIYTEEFLQNIMEMKYIYAVVDEEIEDPSLTEETINSFPQVSLDLILVNYAEEVFHITKDTIVYDLMSDKYILPICNVDSSEKYRLNSLTEIQQEILSRYYPNTDYNIDADTSDISYTINGNKYEINRHENSKGYEFIKNGKKLDISLIKNSSWLKTKERGCSGYSIHLKNVAQIMEMNFEDVQGNAVNLTTRGGQ